MRKHTDEIIRYANSEEGTGVWYKEIAGASKWRLIGYSSWRDNCSYVVDDEWAHLRKALIDGKTLQTSDELTAGGICWSDIPPYFPIEKYEVGTFRVKTEPEFKYPIYKRSAAHGFVVKFTGLTEGEVVVVGRYHYIGYSSLFWEKHTSNTVWEDYNYTEPTYYYRWEKLEDENSILTTPHVTDKFAKGMQYSELGWRRIESSKRTWER